MRTITGLLLVWFWIVERVSRVKQRDGWKGATAGWSPKASVAAVERTGEWDVRGWLTDGQSDVHRALDGIERALRAALIEIREDVYEWSDGFAQAA